MADYRAPVQDVQFILYEVLKLHKTWAQLPAFEECDRDTANAILEEAAKLCEQVIAPLNALGDEQGCRWSDGSVFTPSGYRDAYKAFNDGAWGALGGNPEFGGMGLPKSLVATVEEMVQGACMSFGLAPMLTAGACLALESHGSEALKGAYLEKMISGQWSGAMDLTEPQAGTDLGLMRTRAVPSNDGSYRITGNKIFITWGEHDMAENIVHLVLAKAPDAPDGTRGISMFLVPKFTLDSDGNPSNRNAVHCGALEQKMGIKGSATCVMNFDGAQGWLVGELNKGLACMFTMMNYERLTVGIQALATSHWAYLNAVDYAKNRIQGKGPYGTKSTGPKDLLSHADVRRMLLTCKALNEGGRAFYIYVAQCLDNAKFATDPIVQQRAQKRVDLLTPVAKAFLTDQAFLCAVEAQQVFGGHGFIKEWGQEQFVRDIRITQIYEGTNGVQAMDLVGRKTLACNGTLLEDFLEEVEAEMKDLASPELVDYISSFGTAIDHLRLATQLILDSSKADPGLPGAVAVDYLHLLGYVAVGYMWLKMMACVQVAEGGDFAASKWHSGQFYFQRILPKTHGVYQSILGGPSSLGKMEYEHW